MTQQVQEVLPSLKFESYKRDPLATLILDRLNWKPWMFAGAYIGVFFALHSIAYLVLMLKPGVMDIRTLGGYGVISAVNILHIITIGYGSWFYLYMSKKTGEIYQELSDDKIIDNSDSRVYQFVKNNPMSLEKMQNSLKLPLIASGFAFVIFMFTLYSVALDPNISDKTIYRSNITLFLLPIWFLGLYMIGIVFGRAIVTMYGLLKIFRIGVVRVHPLHPDKYGGLRTLNNYALSIAALIAVFGIAVVLSIYIVTGSPGSSIVAGDWERLGEQLGLIITIAAYVIVSPLLFFGTLSTAHGPMANVKSAYLQELSNQFNRYYEYVHTRLGSEEVDVSDHFDRLKHVHELHRITNSFPVWPFDFTSIQRFLAVYLSPFVLSGITLAIQVFLGFN